MKTKLKTYQTTAKSPFMDYCQQITGETKSREVLRLLRSIHSQEVKNEKKKIRRGDKSPFGSRGFYRLVVDVVAV